MKALVRTLSVLTIACCLASAAAAQNLISNATFDVSTVPWTSVPVRHAFSALDAFGSTTSGSMAVTNTGSIEDTVTRVTYVCIAITPGNRYDLQVDYVKPQAVADGWVSASVWWYANSTCSAALNIVGGPIVPTPDGKWQRLTSQFTPPSTARGAILYLEVLKGLAGGSVTVNFDNVVFKAAGTCAPLPNIMCLNDNRFEVQATWNTSTQTGPAFVSKLTNDSGYLWFFSPTNVEVVLKVLNGCGVNGMYWFFSGGLTDQGVDIKVTDAKTGTTRTYSNLRGSAFQPIQDTSAFSTCP